ncbi:hypothetical protein OG590_09430 [Streptomyces goshikiensis]|uniref:hypothetical protein n=1 Tax=Streptomyces TaxID=1883 RepID=UPI000563560B|nr:MULTISPECIES: hypothetical protein [Streptomyces]AKL68459.1 hypothetical protein M444_26915 [Streptomyces sp. Mg1]RPK36561.1 hypothetical protein EES37_26795 [Streptomyces sp. ADI91-18]WBY22693.1 hypothetical protein PET44_25480 [Streptomyces goshikiensis]WSX97440.1 hypothetical protein OG590_09430 [Streptomyces goshikiensis]
MTAEAPAQRTPDPASAPAADAGKERRQADRIEAWSIAWMLLAMLMWGCFAFLMLSDYGPQSGDRALCRGPLVRPVSESSLCRDELRQWPALLGVLALAAVVTVVAAATTVYAKVLSRLAHHEPPGARPRD